MIPRVTKRGRAWIYMVPAFLLASATALAGTTGNLTGYVQGPNGTPLSGVKVTVTAPVLQGSRTATTDAQGFFRLTQLPPGENYRVRFEASGYKTTERTGIRLSIDETIRIPTVKLQQQQQMEAIDVYEEAPAVETGTTNIGRTLSSEFLSVVPTGRTTTAVLQLAPGAATDALGTTFRGATSPENSYVVDGLNTTGVLYGLDTSALPPEFIQEIQVKTGGYEPEYGRATGGQAIVITKSGGNEFHGDAFLYVTPIEGRRHSTATSGDVPGNNESPNARAAYAITNQHQNLFAQVGFDLGGYIIKDKLWFFAGYAPDLRVTTWGHEFRTAHDIAVTERGRTYDAAAEDPYEYLRNLQDLNDPLDPDLTDKAVYDQQRSRANYYLVNFTYNINQDHSVRVSASGNPRVTDGVQVAAFAGDPGTYMGSNKGGAKDYSLTYNGKFAGGLVNLDTVVGYHTEADADTPLNGVYNSVSGNSAFEGQTINGQETPIYQHRYYYTVPVSEDGANGGCSDGTDLDGDGAADPCYYYFYLSGGFGGMNHTRASRLAVKPIVSIFLNNMVGNHVIKFGGDAEYNKVENYRGFSGGAIVDVFRRSASGVPYFRYRERYYSNFGEAVLWNGFADDSSYFSTNSQTTNYSAFAQDSWSVLSNLSLSLGIRWESQNIMDVQGKTRISIKDNVAPRLGAIFDFTNEGKSKLFANFGRYYESIPMDINDRALSAEGFNYYQIDDQAGVYPVGSPAALALGPDGVAGTEDDFDYNLPQFGLGGEVSPVQQGLKGQYSDQYLLGFEYEVMKNMSAGVTGIYATLGNVIEDISPDNGNTYLIANPGSDNFGVLETEFDPETGTLGEQTLAEENFRRCIAAMDPLTGAPTAYCFPKATRYYRALEFNVNRRLSDNWTAQAAYTWSQTIGNYPGLFAQSRGQLDPNITSQFDLPSLLSNRYGYLDTDRTHLLKFSGAYMFSFGTSLGLTANIQSGIPILYLGAHPVYGSGEAFIVPRASLPIDGPDGIASRTPWVMNIDASVHHTLSFPNKHKLELGAQINNILNQQAAQRVSQVYTRDYIAPAAGGSELSQSQCFDQTGFYPKSSCDVEANFGVPTSYQAPFSLRLEAKYSF